MGTSFSVILPAAFSPPLATKNTRTPTAAATHFTGSPKSPHAEARAFTWTILPMAREESAQPRAYTPPRAPPILPARSMYERGPEALLPPSLSFAAK